MQITHYSGNPIHVNGGLGEFNFGSFIEQLSISAGKLATTATEIYVAKKGADAAREQAKQAFELQKLQLQNNAFPNGNYDFLNSPNYSPIYGGGNPSGFPVAPVLMLAGLGLAAYLVLRK